MPDLAVYQVIVARGRAPATYSPMCEQAAAMQLYAEECLRQGDRSSGITGVYLTKHGIVVAVSRSEND